MNTAVEVCVEQIVIDCPTHVVPKSKMVFHAIIPVRFLSLTAHLVLNIMFYWSRVSVQSLWPDTFFYPGASLVYVYITVANGNHEMMFPSQEDNVLSRSAAWEGFVRL